jgi:hypothetical protein
MNYRKSWFEVWVNTFRKIKYTYSGPLFGGSQSQPHTICFTAVKQPFECGWCSAETLKYSRDDRWRHLRGFLWPDEQWCWNYCDAMHYCEIDKQWCWSLFVGWTSNHAGHYLWARQVMMLGFFWGWRSSDAGCYCGQDMQWCSALHAVLQCIIVG